MSAAMCRICGYQVFTQEADNVLRNNHGESDCPGAYWIVEELTPRRRAIQSFISTIAGRGPAVRAREFAKRKKGYVARQIEPHGHQTK